MPLQPTTAQTRFENILTSLTAAMATFDEVSHSVETPFLRPISSTIQSLLTVVQTVKKNRDDCAQMLEQIHGLIYAIIRLHITSDTGSELPPDMLYNLGKFTETLHKIHAYFEAQQEKSRIKQFFRQGEMSTLLRGCNTGLAQALEVFKVQGNFNLQSDIMEMQHYAQKTHQQVLELISSLSDGASSFSRVFSSKNSSNSLSLLPSEPKIFHGRESEVSAIVDTFSHEVPRIAILGAGGMGKTSLARAVIHHSHITTTYQEHRLFIACDTTSTSVQLAALIGAHLGLKPAKDLTRPVIHYFTNNPASLLVLDNLETLWEPLESRGDMEKFLCLLADIAHLALIITMRGAERPSNIRWTHPFLPPLKPLTQEAARKTFTDIADEGYSTDEIDKILLLADNMPLAIDLVAHLVDYEGFSTVLNRWETERTSVLSEGHDKGSNLDLSISISLGSPRITSLPDSLHLLSLLSLLPDGITDTDLLQAQLPIINVLACKTALLGTALAYTDDQKRLKALGPIREYVNSVYPPAPNILQPILKHFHKLLDIHEKYFGTMSAPEIVARITSNFANIQNILVHGLNPDDPDLVTAIYCICNFDRFIRQVGHGRTQLMDRVPAVLPQLNDPRLEVYFLMRSLAGWRYSPIPDPHGQITQALEMLPCFHDPDLKCKFYNTIAGYYLTSHDLHRSTHFSETALSLAILTGSTESQSNLLCSLAGAKWKTGDHSAAQQYAYESQRLAKICGDLFGEARALRIESLCWRSRGNYKHSLPLFKRARDLLHLCGLSGGQLDHEIMYTEADVYRLKSEYAEARTRYSHIIGQVSPEEDPFEHALASLNLAQIDMDIGALRQDVQMNINAASSVLKTVEHPLAAGWCDMVQAALQAREGELLEANILFQKCLKLAWEKDSETVAYCLERLGDFRQWNNMGQTSPTWTVLSLVYNLKTKQKLETHKAVQFLGDVYLANGDWDTAINLFIVALEGFTEMDVHRSRGECMLRLGDVSSLQGDSVKAVEFWRAARPLFERSSQLNQVADIDDKIAPMSYPLPEDRMEPIGNLNALSADPEAQRTTHNDL